MMILTIVGVAAGFFTTFSFAPQAIKTLRTRDTSGISMLMYFMFLIGVLFWSCYGLMEADWILVTANVVEFFLALPVFCIAVHNACIKKNKIKPL